jgi:type I restriction enzyme M protein
VHLYNPENRPELEPTWGMENPEGRWRRCSYEEIMHREGANLALS